MPTNPPSTEERPASSAEPGAPRRRRGRWLRAGLGAAVSTLLTILVFVGIDFAAVLREMREFSALSLVGSLVLTLAGIPPRAVQWQWLLGRSSAVTFRESQRCLCLGYLGNCLLPMRGGELLRTYLLARATSLPISRVLVSVVLSRVQDLLPVLLLLLLGFQVIDLGSSVMIGGRGFLEQPIEVSAAQLTGVLTKFAALVGSIAVCLGLTFIWPGATERLLRSIAGRLSRRFGRLIEPLVAQLVEALGAVGSASSFGRSQLLAFCCWVIFALVGVPLVMSFGIGFAEAFKVSIAVLGMSAVAQMLPSLPGAIGTSHAASVLAIRLMLPDLDPAAAVAFALVFHFISTIMPGVTGLAYLPGTWNRVLDALAHRRAGSPEPAKPR